MIETL